MSALLYGFATSFSLILAIGAQNAFVLKLGLLGRHVLVAVLICAISDALLILAGVYGFHTLLQKASWIEPVARYGGALFLFIYGLKSFYSAWHDSNSLTPDDNTANNISLSTVVMTILAFTWLNPHVYLDTLVLIGSIGAQFNDERFYFALGAASASFVFFFALGYGAALLRPLFAKPAAWRWLDIVIGLVMWTIAFSLIKP